jgi:hypothetical protein
MSPWLNTADAADYLRYTGKHPLRSVYKFIKRHGLIVRHDGDRVLIARADVERALEGRRQSVSRSRQLDQPRQSVHASQSVAVHPVVSRP